MKHITRFLVFILFVSFVPRVHAMTVKSGESTYVSKGEVVTGTLLAAGNAVVIDGIVHGDVLCAGQSITISGTVDGDVLCMAQSIRITGTVGESVRALAQNVDIVGQIKRNVMFAGQTLSVNTPGAVGGEILAAGQNVFVDTKVGGDMNVAVGALTFGDNARVAGSVRYESAKVAQLASSATIAGTLTQSIPKEMKKPAAPIRAMKKVSPFAMILWKMAIYSVLAIIVNAVAPKRTKQILDAMKSRPMPTAISGLIVLMIVPLIIAGLAITIVGIPLAILLGIAYGLVIAASRIFAAILAGEYLHANFHTNKQNNMLLTIVLGVPVAWVVFSVPILGGIASFLAVIWSLGAMYVTRKSEMKK